MDVADARRLKDLESENERLKRLIAEQLLVIDGLKEFGRKNEYPNGPARRAGSPDSAGARQCRQAAQDRTLTIALTLHYGGRAFLSAAVADDLIDIAPVSTTFR